MQDETALPPTADWPAPHARRGLSDGTYPSTCWECSTCCGALLTVDNTFASPIGQKPLTLGADLVMYSATKSIGGHSDLLAGAVVGAAAALAPVWKARKVFGPVPDPAVAWQIERSLKTLPLRVAAANANALELAQRLAAHPGVAQVMYPGPPSHPGHALAARQMTHFGTVVSFDLRAGRAAGDRRCVRSGCAGPPGSWSRARRSPRGRRAATNGRHPR